MSDYEPVQVVLRSQGDATSAIREMKLLLDLRTDTELAGALNKTQSAIAHWRRKGVIPEGAILDFRDAWQRHQALIDHEKDASSMVVTMRVIRHYQDAGFGDGDVWATCCTLSWAHESIIQAVHATLDAGDHSRLSMERAGRLIEDRAYLDLVCYWIASTDWTDAMGAGLIVGAPPEVVGYG